MIRVRTPSRLHFGLLAPAPPHPALAPGGGEGGVRGGRRFGGVGLMVQAPGIDLSVEGASAWLIEGPLAERARWLVDAILSRSGQPPGPPLHVRIRGAAPEHQGLGTGTQLGLALARALSEAWHWPTLGAGELARLTGRGARSALGTYGFEQGGFLVDGGKQADEPLAPLIARLTFPEAWRIVLILPAGERGLHGWAESEVFQRLKPDSQERTDALSRMVLLGLLPSLVERDFADFSEHLHQFNRLAGEAFREIQGGVYASPRIAELIRDVRNLGIKGVGQSSWGAAVFALVPDQEQAASLRDRLLERQPLTPQEVLITAADNHGARLWRE